MPRMRYVHLPDDATVAEIDAALADLLLRRQATKLAQVRGWIDAEINTALDMRNIAYELEHHSDMEWHLTHA